MENNFMVIVSYRLFMMNISIPSAILDLYLSFLFSFYSLKNVLFVK